MPLIAHASDTGWCWLTPLILCRSRHFLSPIMTISDVPLADFYHYCSLAVQRIVANEQKDLKKVKPYWKHTTVQKQTFNLTYLLCGTLEYLSPGGYLSHVLPVKAKDRSPNRYWKGRGTMSLLIAHGHPTKISAHASILILLFSYCRQKRALSSDHLQYPSWEPASPWVLGAHAHLSLSLPK